MLHESGLEMARYAPPGGESATREELRSAAVKNRFIAADIARTKKTLYAA
ncbi:MAG TPA: hypothetical protein VEG34_10780 [Thermoanaerobaculia bacterium]|nr:hypothetical protein [Thermoanaerobaculia bacterium]